MKLWLVLLIFCFSSVVNAFYVEVVDVKCKENEVCREIKDELENLRRNYTSFDHFKKILNVYVAAEGVKRFDYSLLKNTKGYTLDINISLKMRAEKVSVEKSCTDYDVDIPSILPLREDDFFSKKEINSTEQILENLFTSHGYLDTKFQVDVKDEDMGAIVKISCDVKKPLVVRKINISSKNKFINNFLIKRLHHFKDEPFDLQRLKNDLSLAQIDLRGNGFYLNEIELRYTKEKNLGINIFVKIDNTKLYFFRIKGAKKISDKDVKVALASFLIDYKREVTVENIRQTVLALYKKKGYLSTESKVHKRNYKDKNRTLVNHFDVKIFENSITRLDRVIFKGNNYFKQHELQNHFEENEYPLAEEGIYDESYYKDYVALLREFYFQKGFVNVLVEGPVVKLSRDKKKDTVEYRIREGVRTVIGEINFGKLDENLSNKIKELMINKEKNFFNPIAFQKDLKTVLEQLNLEGFYHAKIATDPESIVTYSENMMTVNINVDVNLGHRLYLNSIIILGNRRTKGKLIRRYSYMESGDLIKRSEVKKFQSKLLSLGLFSSVNVRVVTDGVKKADIIVQVKEKDFGIVELAPGYRTDIGLKLSSHVTYLNIDGLGKQISLKSMINHRIDLEALDETRMKRNKRFVEYEAEVNYAENFIFDSNFNFNTSLSNMKKRFYSFDANILRLNYTFSRDFNSWISAAVKQQFENITQFDASNTLDDGEFRIGSITPSLTFDLRDNKINPLSGAYFNLSFEAANPSFGSQSEDNLVINYYKLVSRNRFYIPIKNGVLASSVSFGQQENLSKDLIENNGQTVRMGYIPSIKAFRLSGIDVVRGYEDSEINKLVSNEDIANIRIDDKAFMFNFKFEPRFFLNDDMMLGVFYDAGRLFVRNFDLGKLRSSVGITFKYLTPVGSLSFDYGIKLLREQTVGGRLESPGRLHVSIGFF